MSKCSCHNRYIYSFLHYFPFLQTELIVVSKWDSSMVPTRADHQIDKNSPIKNACAEMQQIICLLLTLSL